MKCGAPDATEDCDGRPERAGVEAQEERCDANVAKDASAYLLQGGKSAAGGTYPVAFTPGAGNFAFGNNIINNASTFSGSIELHNAIGRFIRSHTTSGDLTYEGSIDPEGRYELSAHSGDIHLTIPSSASAQLSVSTWSGTLDSDFPITLRPGEHGIGTGQAKRFTFDIGGGAARISAETFSGDITISSRGSSRR